MDIQFTTQYGKLFERHEKARLCTYTFENPYGKVVYNFLVKETPFKIDGKIYNDIFTPYGFGGPLIIETSDKTRLLSDYYQAFHRYCLENDIVSEFVRFHPLENTEARESFNGEIILIGPQVIRNLSQPVFQNMSKSLRRDYRNGKAKGFKILFDQEGTYLDDFLSIYYSTMDRNEANQYYYFDKTVFETIHRELKGHFLYSHVTYNNQIICSTIILYGDTYSYSFLGGTKEAFYKDCPEVLLKIETFKFLHEKGISYFLMGGGHGQEDTLFTFKRKFSKDGIFPYHVGKKIHNTDIYKQLIELRSLEKSFNPKTAFFPAYRDSLPEIELVR